MLAPMSKSVVAILTLAMVVAACSSSDASETVTTTSAAPMTTLPPPDENTPTTGGTTSSSAPSTTTTTTLPPENECEVGSERGTEGYGQGCTVLGIDILAAADVDPEAISGQADRMYHMLVGRPDLLDSILVQGVAARVIGADQRITDLPEYTDLYDQYPGTDWRRRGRSFPGTELVPYVAGAEENLRCLEDDVYEGEDIFVRTFALTIKRFGLDLVDPGTSLAIEQAYSRAIAQGLWVNTLAEINEDEYWMEGVQSYFDANLEDTAEEREPNSSHNDVDTRSELAEYDPPLHTIAASVFGDTEWRPDCGG